MEVEWMQGDGVEALRSSPVSYLIELVPNVVVEHFLTLRPQRRQRWYDAWVLLALRPELVHHVHVIVWIIKYVLLSSLSYLIRLPIRLDPLLIRLLFRFFFIEVSWGSLLQELCRSLCYFPVALFSNRKERSSLSLFTSLMSIRDLLFTLKFLTSPFPIIPSSHSLVWVRSYHLPKSFTSVS